MGVELGLANPYEREVFAYIYALTNRGHGGWKGSVRLLAARMCYKRSTIANAVVQLLQKGLIIHDGRTYKTVPKKGEQVPLKPKSVQNMENGVQDPDNFVPLLDENDQNMDKSVQILDSIPNSTINTKVHSVQSGADGQQQKKENIPFDDFWTLFNPDPQYHHLRNRCITIWNEKTDVEQRLIIHDIREFPNHEPSPKDYLLYFKPDSPFFLLRDEIDEYLAEGKVLCYVREKNDEKQPVRVTTKEYAELYGLNILGWVPAKNN